MDQPGNYQNKSLQPEEQKNRSAPDPGNSGPEAWTEDASDDEPVGARVPSQRRSR